VEKKGTLIATVSFYNVLNLEIQEYVYSDAGKSAEILLAKWKKFRTLINTFCVQDEKFYETDLKTTFT